MNRTKRLTMRIEMPPADRRGTMMVFVSVLMVAFLTTIVLCIDAARTQLTGTELRAAADAAAKAAAQELASTNDPAAARRRAKLVAQLNLVDGRPLLLSDEAIEFGRSEQNSTDTKFVFNISGRPINTVRIGGLQTPRPELGRFSILLEGLFAFDRFEPQVAAAATFLERDVVLVVDRSGAMTARGAADLKAAVNVFTNTLADTPVREAVGLASYAAQATEDVQLTTDPAAVTTAIESMEFTGPADIAGGMRAGTAIISGGRNLSFVHRTMILLSAGNDPMPDSYSEALDEAAGLAARGVFIHTVTFGSEANAAEMREIASIGRGKHYHAADGEQLMQIYRELALSLTTMLTK